MIPYATICSGIGAPEAAFHEAWGAPLFTSEIEPFPSAVLKHHYPDVPNYGDMTKFKEWPNHEQLGLICGGTPCQSFSVAGLRKGMDDPRGNLTLTFLAIINKYRPRWFIWENVPGVYSSTSHFSPDEVSPPDDLEPGRGWQHEIDYEADETSDYGCFIAAVQELGYCGAWLVRDAQFFGVPQRRSRVFFVGHLGNDWRPPFAVCFEPESLRGNTPTRKKEGQRIADTLTVGANQYSGFIGEPIEQEIVTIHARQDPISVKGNSQAIAIRTAQTNANGHGVAEDVAHTLDGAQGQAVAFQVCHGQARQKHVAPPLMANSGPNRHGEGSFSTTDFTALVTNTTVRRLTPLECERLQGFPDNYTRIPYKGKPADKCPDGPRYKALGNSMAVPVLRWLRHRIDLWEQNKK